MTRPDGTTRGPLDATLAALEHLILPGVLGLFQGTVTFALWVVPDAPGRYVWANRGADVLLTAAACQVALQRQGDFLSALAAQHLTALGWCPPRETAINWTRTWGLAAPPVVSHLAVTLFTVYGARTGLDVHLSYPEESVSS